MSIPRFSHDYIDSPRLTTTRDRALSPKIRPSIDTSYDRSIDSSNITPGSILGLGEDNHAGPAFGTIFGSAQNTFAASSDPRRDLNSMFSFDTPPNDYQWPSHLQLSNDGVFPPILPHSNGQLEVMKDASPPTMSSGNVDSLASDAFWTELDVTGIHSPIQSISTAQFPFVGGTAHRPSLSSTSSHSSVPTPSMQKLKEANAIMSWAEICFFLSLYIRYQHPVLPLVHKPTFSQDILNRRDRVNDSFRGLICSIGESFTPCQNDTILIASKLPTRKSWLQLI